MSARREMENTWFGREVLWVLGRRKTKTHFGSRREINENKFWAQEDR